MTIASRVSRISYIGDGTTTVFTVPFAFDQTEDLEVMLRAANGSEKTLSPATDYTLSGVGSASGSTCTLAIAPAAETATGADNAEVLVIRLVPCAANGYALPSINPCDAGKAVVVNPAENGYVLSEGGCACGVSIEKYKAPAPIVTGEMSVSEGSAISLTIADHQPGDTYMFTRNPLGLSLSGTSIAGTAPALSLDTVYELRLRRVRPETGLLFSDDCVVNILVLAAASADDPEGLVWDNNATDWPEAGRTEVAVGADQLEPTGSVLEPLTVDATSTTSSLVLTHAQSGMLAEGDMLLLGDDVVFEVPAGVSEASSSTDLVYQHTCDTLDGVSVNGTFAPTDGELVGDTSYPVYFKFNTGYPLLAKTGMVVYEFDYRMVSPDSLSRIRVGVPIKNATQAAYVDGSYISHADTGSGPYTELPFGDTNLVTSTTTMRFEIDLDSDTFTFKINGVTQVADKGFAVLNSVMQARIYNAADGELGGIISSPDNGNHGTCNISEVRIIGETGAYTIPCSPALASVPANAHKLPELSLASATEAGSVTAPTDFADLSIASASRSGAEYTVTCAPVSLPEGTRRLAVGIEGDAWSAYAASKAQEAEQGDWTEATVSMTLASGYCKDATAATVMEN